MSFKIKSLLSIIVINLFLIVAMSIVTEYTSLAKRVQNAEVNISEALDMALEAVVESEEMFSKNYAKYVTSRGVQTGSENATDYKKEYTDINATGLLSTYTIYWQQGYLLNGKLAKGNTYFLSWFYDENKRFPTSDTELDTFIKNKMDTSGLTPAEKSETAVLYQWLFGKSGSIYSSSSLSWANRNTNTNALYTNFGVGTDRTPTTEFQDFYNKVGKKQLSYGYVKNRNGNYYSLSLEPYPTLVSMGLNLDSTYNSTTASKVMDNFVSSIHFAKTKNSDRQSVIGSNIGSYTKYYLTPVALGVTYVPIKPLKAVFLADLEYLIRLSKVSNGGNDATDARDMTAATGCMETPVIINSDKKKHIATLGAKIINDGEIEYDLNTAQVKVDYFCVNFKDETNANQVLMGKLRGLAENTTSTQAQLREENLRDYTKQFDTNVALYKAPSSSETEYNNSIYTAIIARVSCKIKIYIPYKSDFMQWFRYLEDPFNINPNHYSIRLWQPNYQAGITDGSINTSDDGVWYTYTTYYMVKR